MPSIAQESPTVQSSKKRRLDDSSHQIPFAVSAVNSPRTIFADKTFDHGSLYQQHHPSALAARKIMSLPPSKRQRTVVDIDVETDEELMHQSPSQSPTKARQQQPQREHHQPSEDASRGQPDDKTRPQPPTSAASLMSRCHICSRKPNKKSDLDCFADCQGCGQRTCYICIRECPGWGGVPNSQPPTNHPTRASLPPAEGTPAEEDEEIGEASFTMADVDAEDLPQPRPSSESQGAAPRHGQGWSRGGGHRKTVCSRCCVEKGQHGEVVCLGCLPFVEG